LLTCSIDNKNRVKAKGERDVCTHDLDRKMRKKNDTFFIL